MLGEKDIERDIKVLGWRIADLEQRLGRTRVRSTAWTAIALLVLTLFVPQFHNDEDDLDDRRWYTLRALGERASRLDEGALHVTALLTLIGVVLKIVAALLLISADKRAAVPAMVVAGLTVVLWLALVFVARGPGGRDADADATVAAVATVRTLLVPLACGVTLVAAVLRHGLDD